MEYKVDIREMQKADVPQALEAVGKAFQDGRRQTQGERRRTASP
jgi:acyl-CoA reductase-like NAD-dependent aldehyde dehydrogenase